MIHRTNPFSLRRRLGRTAYLTTLTLASGFLAAIASADPDDLSTYTWVWNSNNTDPSHAHLKNCLGQTVQWHGCAQLPGDPMWAFFELINGEWKGGCCDPNSGQDCPTPPEPPAS